ncbi:MAG TPA: hypothetical protein VG711_07265 [Phycisphaerales bacterium]|nr:hypothetical protein [Phycisphaerales bacterium]
MKKLTVAHVTHEASEKIGGIGAVLEGFITSPAYQQSVGRSILIGPYYNHLDHSPEERLGEHGTVLYSTIDGIDDAKLGSKLHPIEWAFNVAFIYGKRRFEVPGDHLSGESEILLVDVFNISKDRLNNFKKRLFDTLNINSLRYENDWAFEEYVRLAEPAFYGLLALLGNDELPAVIFSHEFMGLPTAFKAILDGQHHFRTVFHAHECATARNLVEHHPGHDARFYNILSQARDLGLYVDDVFGDQSASFRHALISQCHTCDAVVAVGDYTAREMHFLGSHFDHHEIDLVYNGVPAMPVSWKQKSDSRAMLLDYSQKLLGFRPDHLFTHVTRPVISKGAWRDLQICHELDSRLAARGRKAVLFIVTSAGGTRRPQDVRHMENEYAWPRHHRMGYPDLVGPEVDFNAIIDAFNASHSSIQAVLVNQFGWSSEKLGLRAPVGMDIADLRRATDLEFGLATYEPFGISPLEPLAAGALCAISTVCGCLGFINHVTRNAPPANIIVGDYITLQSQRSIPDLLGMTQFERDQIEHRVAADLADLITTRLPYTDAARQALLESGQKLVHKLSWDAVLRDTMLPLINRLVTTNTSASSIAGQPTPSSSRQPVIV